jgi:hypothetical protein
MIRHDMMRHMSMLPREYDAVTTVVGERLCKHAIIVCDGVWS